VGNANRLRRYRHTPLPPVTDETTTRPTVEVAADRALRPETHVPHPDWAPDDAAIDPVCGMQIDPATATERRDTNAGTVYFCSPRCAASFDADCTATPHLRPEARR
jgi:Cu+-exporting ATPase